MGTVVGSPIYYNDHVRQLLQLIRVIITNAMLYLVSLPQQVRVSVYSINLDNLISVNLDKDVIKTNANVNLNQKF